MKEVWYFLYRDYDLDGEIFSSSYYDTFEEAWESRKSMKDDSCGFGNPISPVMKGYVKDE